MKYLKIIFSIMLINTLISCQEEPIDSKNEQINFELLNLNNLKKDSRFNSYIKKNKNVVNNIKDVKTVKILSEKENLNEQEQKQLSLAIGFESFEKYVKYYENQKKILLDLEKDYKLSSYNSEDIKKALLNDNISETSLQQRLPCLSRCARTAKNCNGAVGAAAVAGHIGCLSADLTVVGGVVCHAAVLAVQYFAGDECLNQYEQCGSNCLEIIHAN